MLPHGPGLAGADRASRAETSTRRLTLESFAAAMAALLAGEATTMPLA